MSHIQVYIYILPNYIRVYKIYIFWVGQPYSVIVTFLDPFLLVLQEMSRFKDPQLNLHLPLLGRGTTQAIWSYSRDVSRYLEDMTSTQYGNMECREEDMKRYGRYWKIWMELCNCVNLWVLHYRFGPRVFVGRFLLNDSWEIFRFPICFFKNDLFTTDSLDSRNRSGVLDASKIRSFPFIWGNFPLTWSAYGRKSNLHFWAFMLDSSGCCWVSVLQDPISSMPEDAIMRGDFFRSMYWNKYQHFQTKALTKKSCHFLMALGLTFFTISTIPFKDIFQRRYMAPSPWKFIKHLQGIPVSGYQPVHQWSCLYLAVFQGESILWVCLSDATITLTI